MAEVTLVKEELFNDGSQFVAIIDGVRINNITRQSRYWPMIQDWIVGGGVPDVVDPAPVHTISKATIIERLNTAGLLAEADTALKSDLLTRMRWEAAPDRIPADDANIVALITAISADPNVILAEET